jgi:hypothetical protein
MYEKCLGHWPGCRTNGCLFLPYISFIRACASATASDASANMRWWSLTNFSAPFLVNTWELHVSVVSNADLDWRPYLSSQGRKPVNSSGQLLRERQMAGRKSSHPFWSYLPAMAHLRTWISGEQRIPIFFDSLAPLCVCNSPEKSRRWANIQWLFNQSIYPEMEHCLSTLLSLPLIWSIRWSVDCCHSNFSCSLRKNPNKTRMKDSSNEFSMLRISGTVHLHELRWLLSYPRLNY